MEHTNPKSETFSLALNRFYVWANRTGARNLADAAGQDETRRRCLAMAAEIQKAYGEALGRQTELFTAATGKAARLLPQFLESKCPADVGAVQLEILAAFLESAAPWTETWGELAQKSSERVAAFARETASELHRAELERLFAGKPPVGSAPVPAV